MRTISQLLVEGINAWLRQQHANHLVLSTTEAAQRDAADAAFEGVQRFAECLTNGLRIAGPSEKQ